MALQVLTGYQRGKQMRIFRCRTSHIADETRIDAPMKKIIQLVDGRKSLASIAFASGLTMSDFQKAVKMLIDMELIVPVDPEDGFPD